MNPIQNPTEVSGFLGEAVTVRKINGRVVIKNRPRRKVVSDPTPKQLAVTRKFTKAHEWAKKQMERPDVKSLYEARVTSKLRSPFSVAATDFLIPPVVESIDTENYRGAIGDVISAEAYDDFMLTQVEVLITDAAGNMLEKGIAKQDIDKVFLYTYVATVANPALAGTKISVSAYDRPGNKTTLEKVL